MKLESPFSSGQLTIKEFTLESVKRKRNPRLLEHFFHFKNWRQYSQRAAIQSLWKHHKTDVQGLRCIVGAFTTRHGGRIAALVPRCPSTLLSQLSSSLAVYRQSRPLGPNWACWADCLIKLTAVSFLRGGRTEKDTLTLYLKCDQLQLTFKKRAGEIRFPWSAEREAFSNAEGVTVKIWSVPQQHYWNFCKNMLMSHKLVF